MTAISPNPIDSLAAALFDAQDQLLALYELATLTTESLDESECVKPILERASRLLDADEMRFTLSDDEPEVDTTSIDVENSSGLSGTLHARRAALPFGTADQKLLRAVAHIALGAVQTSRLHSDAVSQAVVARDHDTASNLAQMALPSWRPTIDGLDMFARSDPARLAGGDLFTFAESATRLHVVVGDVSGKGLPAAMMMATIISSANAALHSHGDNPEEILRSIDSWVFDYLSESGLFVTILAGTIDKNTGELRVANAGHSPVVLVLNGVPTVIEATAPPVGVLPLGSTTLEEQRFELRPNDRFVVCSDGFSEQLNLDEEMYGEDRLFDQVSDMTKDASTIGPQLFSQLDHFANGATQTDDRTLVIVDYQRDAVSSEARS